MIDNNPLAAKILTSAFFLSFCLVSIQFHVFTLTMMDVACADQLVSFLVLCLLTFE